MENRCLIIMPPGEQSGYSPGHFNRVYEYVVVPACRAAGFWPTKSDSLTPDDPLDVAKTIIDSEIAICDLSTNNSNALYGFAIRHALDLPVTLIKDTKTLVSFDTNDVGLVEYDETLRIDTVQKAIEVLTEALKKAVENKKDRHALLKRLSLGVQQFTGQSAMMDNSFDYSADQAAREEEAKAKEPKLPKISPLPDYVRDPFTEVEIAKLKAGHFLFHLNHGKGKVEFVKNAGKDKLASIQFESGTKLLVLAATDYFRKISE